MARTPSKGGAPRSGAVPGKSAAESEIAEAADVTSLEELCLICRVEQTWVSELVTHGAIAPHELVGGSGRFDAATVLRVKKAHRLARDLDLNVPGIALALDLLDEIERLRGMLRAFDHDERTTRIE